MELETNKEKIDRQMHAFICVFAFFSGLLYSLTIDFERYSMGFGILKGLVTYTIGYTGIIKTFEYLQKLTAGPNK